MSLNSLRSLAGNPAPLLKYGVLSSAEPVKAQSWGPDVLSGRCPNLECAVSGLDFLWADECGWWADMVACRRFDITGRSCVESVLLVRVLGRRLRLWLRMSRGAGAMQGK